MKVKAKAKEIRIRGNVHDVGHRFFVVFQLTKITTLGKVKEKVGV